MMGNVCTVYMNGAQGFQVIGNTYARGGPGMEFYIEGTTSVNGDYGFTSFTATDESISQPDTVAYPAACRSMAAACLRTASVIWLPESMRANSSARAVSPAKGLMVVMVRLARADFST